MRPIIVDIQSECRGDLNFVAGSRNHIELTGVMRPMVLVHDMEWFNPVESAIRRTLLAQSLSSFAQGYIRHRPLIPQGCLFHVAPGNATMEAFARTLGGEPEAGLTYRIDYAVNKREG
jgi:hypothetical protein